MSQYSECHVRVLRAVGDDRITWRQRGARRALKMWTSDDTSRPLTVAERRHLFALIADGRVRSVDAPGYGGGLVRGGYELVTR